MYIIDVKVRHAPVGQGAHDRLFDVLLPVEGVPELGDDGQVLTLDDALIDGTLDTLASLLLVAVI